MHSDRGSEAIAYTGNDRAFISSVYFLDFLLVCLNKKNHVASQQSDAAY